MKGLVFTEFLEMVESAHGMDTTDELLELPSLESGGIYTAVGTYDAGELVSMVVHLSEMIDTPFDDLLIGFGEHLFGRFHEGFPQMFEGKTDALEFLESIHEHIHVEVRKLYPEADLPDFAHERRDGGLVLTYTSKRPFAKFALGLIHGCLAHYGGAMTVSYQLLGSGDGTRAEFTIQ
ncbi:MAG: hypothetical protein ACI8QC_003719 [Planctomycetota bacterium]|jgi:hypothetical protein